MAYGNPRFSELGKVLTKVALECSRMVLCSPGWGAHVGNKRGGAPRDGEGQCAIASEGYLSDVEVRLHNVHMHDQVLITKKDEHVEEISMRQ